MQASLSRRLRLHPTHNTTTTTTSSLAPIPQPSQPSHQSIYFGNGTSRHSSTFYSAMQETTTPLRLPKATISHLGQQHPHASTSPAVPGKQRRQDPPLMDGPARPVAGRVVGGVPVAGVEEGGEDEDKGECTKQLPRSTPDPPTAPTPQRHTHLPTPPPSPELHPALPLLTRRIHIPLLITSSTPPIPNSTSRLHESLRNERLAASTSSARCAGGEGEERDGGRKRGKGSAEGAVEALEEVRRALLVGMLGV